ncbi:MAG: cytochrome b [Betaproteobacteria bacterium]|nr:cytochrome b [Betaproteobacteria bacterium]
MTSTRYSRTAITLHWLVALFIFAGFGLGLTMVDMSFSPQKLKFYSWHKWIGLTIFALVAIRLVWRLTHPAPAMPASMPAWQRRAAHVSHLLMYVLFFAIPLSGWLFSSAKGIQTVYLGLLPLPDLLTKDMGDIVLAAAEAEKPFTVSELIRLFHKFMNYLLGALVLMHIAAALKHHFIDRDDILGRMLPWLKSRS